MPAILEYIPYRRRDGTRDGDDLTHPYFAGHGYACVRLDIRGSGDSDGVILDEYLKQEQDDAVEAIAWIARQPWCSGKVGMMGISWGGFNSLQVAARRPPALKAIITLCSTDDRYADDMHYMGGCLINGNLEWGSSFFSSVGRAPDPRIVGERWREMWLDRLEHVEPFHEIWMRHPWRDEFWRHGSVCEDFTQIKCAVFAVGGWADGYSNAVFRLLANLKSPRKGLVGPWGHKYPHFGMPGPAIGFLQECAALVGSLAEGPRHRHHGRAHAARLARGSGPAAGPSRFQAGRWVAEESWPSPRVGQRRWRLERGLLAEGASVAAGEGLAIASPQTVGLTAGSWCPYGVGHDQPIDQRPEAGGSLVFDTAPLAVDIEVLGAPVVELDVSADRPNALLACTLSEILPGGAVSRVTYGLLNLTHRESHEHPTPLEPGKRYQVKVRMNHCGHRFAAGTSLRLAISTAYWPVAWPSPEPATVTVLMGSSGLVLPLRPARAEDAALAPFGAPEASPKLRKTQIEPGWENRTVTQDRNTGAVVWDLSDSDGTNRIEDIDLTFAIRRGRRLSIHPDDPTTAKVELSWHRAYSRGDWRVSSACKIVMTCSAEAFRLTAEMDAFEGEQRVFSRNWDETIPRDLT